MATATHTRSFLIRATALNRSLYFWETFRGTSPKACLERARAIYPFGKFQICDARPVAIADRIAGDAYTSLAQALTSFRSA